MWFHLVFNAGSMPNDKDTVGFLVNVPYGSGQLATPCLGSSLTRWFYDVFECEFHVVPFSSSVPADLSRIPEKGRSFKRLASMAIFPLGPLKSREEIA